MFFRNIFTLSIILTLEINIYVCFQYENSENVLFIDAGELSNIVQNTVIKKRAKVHTEFPTVVTNLLSSKEESRIERNNDELMLRLRKIWSRWGKWSGCSVTCGEGIISRRRLCVSGRCASGEFEEQRRPCKRRPCDCYTVDDLHDRD